MGQVIQIIFTNLVKYLIQASILTLIIAPILTIFWLNHRAKYYHLSYLQLSDNFLIQKFKGKLKLCFMIIIIIIFFIIIKKLGGK